MTRYHAIHSRDPIASRTGDIRVIISGEPEVVFARIRRTTPRRLRRADPRCHCRGHLHLSTSRSGTGTSSSVPAHPHRSHPHRSWGEDAGTADTTTPDCGPDAPFICQPDHAICGQLIIVEEGFTLPPQAPFFHILWIPIRNFHPFAHNPSLCERRTVGSRHIEHVSEGGKARIGRG